MSDTELLLAILRPVESILEDGGLSEVRRAVLDDLLQAATILWLRMSHEGNCCEEFSSSVKGH